MNPAEILSAARMAADLLLSLAPHGEASQLLDDAAVKRANAIADTAEKLKFPDAET